MENTKRRLEALPTELLETILFCAPDARTLRDLALSCSLLYTIFKNGECSIVRSVIKNEFPPAILPEALAVWRASQFPDGPFSLADDEGQELFLESEIFVQMYLHRDFKTSMIFSLNEHLQLSNLIADIDFFVGDFVNSLSHPFQYYPIVNGLVASLSRLEIQRIQRAFYRYEVYCNLFRMEACYNDEFFSTLAPFENEQLATIYECLIKKINPSKIPNQSSARDYDLF